MLISDTHRFVFIHVPKTGGDSISAALKPYADGLDASAGDRKHWTARRTRELLFGPQDQRCWSDYVSFGVIRNPWEQVHSDYWFCRRHPDPGPELGNWRYKVLRCKEITFAQFVRDICGEHGRAGVGHAEHYLCDRTGRQMVTRILQHEHLQDHVYDICQTIGLPPLKLPHLNVTPKRPRYQDDYDSRSRFLVARRFADDINRFHYTFDGK